MNEEIANQFVKLLHPNNMIGPRVKRSILDCIVDIKEFWQKYKTIEGLDIYGMKSKKNKGGSQTKRILELLLENGFDKAKEILYREHEDRFRPKPGPKIRKSGGEPSPWQENAVRDLEG